MLMMFSRLFRILPLTFLGAIGCVDPPPGKGAGDTSVYVYDNASGDVLAWNQVDALCDTGGQAPEDRRLQSGTLRNCRPLWGGLTLDASTDCLYLVPAIGGTVTRMRRARIQNQDGSGIQAKDLDTFQLGTPGDRFGGGSLFGPASVNPRTGVLYVTETSRDRSQSRIWQIPAAATTTDESRIPAATAIAQVASDKGFSGAVGGRGSLFYGYFPSGNTVYSSAKRDGQDGPRIRSGSQAATGFSKTSGVIAGHPALQAELPGTPTYGCLAFDSIHNLLYVSRQAPQSDARAVLVFSAGQFSPGFRQEPERSLEDTTGTLPNLRFIVHAETRDWLAGLDWLPPTLPPRSGEEQGGVGNHQFHLWKSPNGGGASALVTLPSAVQIGGIAFDAGS